MDFLIEHLVKISRHSGIVLFTKVYEHGDSKWSADVVGNVSLSGVCIEHSEKC